ncbi:MAG: hypothetical protein HDT07_04750 [Bacteroidales bacterium]|nr:hypothetical protein [Bacteroidales bacterium]
MNNGITGWVDLKPTEKGGIITYSDTTTSEGIFYQPIDFVGYSHVQGLYPYASNIWDEDSLLYFTCAFKKAAAGRFDYANKFNRAIASKLKVVLPTKGGDIDFDFMRRYIATLKAYLQAAGLSDTILSEAELATLVTIRQNRVEWREYPISGENGAFKVVNTHSILKAQVVPDSGNIPYVGAGESNNSIQSYISFDSNFLEKGNSIMIGGKTMVITYQEDDYFSNDSHNLALYYKDIDIPTRNTQLFLVSALYKSLKPKYHWGDSISKSKIRKDSIMLPVKKDGNIDYEFIENIISAQTKLCIKDILNHKDLEISITQNLIKDTKYLVEDNESYQQAAEPYEIYHRNTIKETILIGCYRDKKHLEWIMNNHLYNIRLGGRKGSAKGEHECIAKAVRLYLYNSKDYSKVKVYEIKRHQEMSGKELSALEYPRKSPGKNYMVFSLGDECNYNQFPLNVSETLSSLPNHINGAPVFIEPE